MNDFIPFARPSLSECEISSVAEVLRSGWWSTGPKVREFEERFAEYVGANHAVALNSATAGLHVALDALGVAQGDATVTSTYTFVASAEVALYSGAHPFLLDVEDESLCVDPAQVEALLDAVSGPEVESSIGSRVASGALPPGCARYADLAAAARIRAVLPVHFAGKAADMGRILDVARGHGVSVVEDAAHAVETWSGTVKVGSISDATVFSFYATKNLSTGEGGMVTTQDAALADRMRRLSLHGISRDAWKRYEAAGSWYYEVLEQGYKYNMTDIAAALGLCQLDRIEVMADKRVQVVRAYTERLQHIDSIRLPEFDETERRAWHLFVIRLVPGLLRISRDEFVEKLRELGVGASVHFIPLHLHPYYRGKYGYAPGDFPIAEAAYQAAVSLPLYPDLTEIQVERVCAAIEGICAEFKS